MFENLKKLNTGRTRVKVVAAMLAIILTFANFTFLGSHIGKKSYATDIEEKKVKTTWETDEISEDDLELSQEVITNKTCEINGEAKRVVQVLVKSSVKENKVPVKQTNIEISTPEIEVLPEEVKVSSYSTKATNGKTDIEFADLETSSWKYDSVAGKINIEILNPADENGNIAWEKDCKDEIIVTYIYEEDVEVAPFISNAKLTVEIYGEEENVTVEKIDTLELEEMEEIENFVTVANNLPSSIYKGNLYISGKEEYTQTYNLYVSYKELAKKVQIEDLGDEILEASTYYNKTLINKKEAINVLGKEGIINIYNAEDRELLQSIDLSEEIEEDYIIVEYAKEISKILIVTSSAQKEGKIEITNQKEIKISDEATVQEINKLISNVNLLVADEENKIILNKNLVAEAKVEEPSTKYSISIDKTKLVTAVENDLQITAELKTENSSDKLFANPEIRIEMPAEITEAKIENITPILHSEELKLKSYEVITNKEGNKEIVIQTEGTQTEYTKNNAYVAIDLKVETEEFIESNNSSLKITCINGEDSIETTKDIELVSKRELVTENTLSIEEETLEEINKNSVEEVITENANIDINSELINNFEEALSNANMEGTIEEESTLSKVSEVEDQVEIKISPKAMTEDLYEGQIVTYEIAVKNNSAKDLENPKIVYTVPEGAVLTELTYSQGSEIIYTDKEKIAHRTITFEGTLGAGKTRTAKVTLRIKNDAKQIVHNIEAQTSEGEVIGTLVTEPVKVISGDLNVVMSRKDNWMATYTEGHSTICIIMVTNNTNKEMKNLQITSKVPENTSWLENSKNNAGWTYNKQTGEISYKLNSLPAGKTEKLYFEIKIDKVNNITYEDEFDNMALVTTASGAKYASNVYENKTNKAVYKITLESPSSKTLKEGDNIKYVINVTNIGKRTAYASIIDNIPEEIEVTKVTTYTKEEEEDKNTHEIDSNDIKLSLYSEPGKANVIEIEGKVKNLEDGVASKKITNIVKVGEKASNSIVTTIVKNDNKDPNDPNNPNNPSNPSDPSNPNNPTNPNDPSSPNNPGSPNDPNSPVDPSNPENSGNKEGLYSISGMVWLDKNKDGIRENSEEEVQSQSILLLDEEGKVIKETKSSLTGTYKFTGLAKGKYLVAIVYDKDKYAVTKYQAVVAKESENSDVVAKQITIDSKNVQVGITDTITISNKNISNIDMGLIENPVFDLSLNKYISKVVVTTKEEVKTYEYDEPTNLAKVEISKKEISGASLLVEYEIEVVNEGDVEGYVTDIIDYLPKELTFSSEMNPEWYKGADNNLHYMALEPKSIAPGKSQKVKLVLTKNLKNNSVGTIENIAEIGENTNLEGITERDSIAGNYKEGEDDISKAELIVSIKTGGSVFYIGIVIASMLVLGIGIYIINKKVLKVRF